MPDSRWPHKKRRGNSIRVVVFPFFIALSSSWSLSSRVRSESIPSFMAQAGQTNVWGQPLAPCSFNPQTGWYRDGFCRTDSRDHGVHTVCAAMTREFLEFTRAQGNDLSSAHPPHFPGLKPGDRWCLCSSRWDEARRAGVPPQVVLEATNQVTLARGVAMEHLQDHAAPPHQPSPDGAPPTSALPDDSSSPSADQCPIVPKQ